MSCSKDLQIHLENLGGGRKRKIKDRGTNAVVGVKRGVIICGLKSLVF
jgi:hypothetical protein